MIRLLAVAACLSLGACNLVFPKDPATTTPPPPKTRADFDRALRAELAAQPGDACAKSAWIATRAKTTDGLEAEVAEELKTEQAYACKVAKNPKLAEPQVEPEPEPLVFEGACTRADAEAKLRARGDKTVDKPAIENAFALCFSARIKTCQTALDADIEQGAACWKKHPWPETPTAVEAADVGATAICLGELQAVLADLRGCASKKKAADRDACVTPYVGYVPKCALLDASRAWAAFPGQADLARIANADAKKRAERDAKLAKEKAEQEARIAKEIARCNGGTTVELAVKLASVPALAKVPGCRYKVVGNVLSKNNVYVQLADDTGKIVFLVRTREPLAPGAPLGDRTAVFDSVEDAELADGTTRRFAVFTLERK